ncbi:MAG: chemotaxis response regulator protein-glutamate methylesterase [Mariprofundus sp.]|nr:chemotaxis response regulator protein-glutamate methylesterase [Mariprofundus sp.]
MGKKIRVILVDDSAVVRRQLQSILATEHDIEIHSTAIHGRMALDMIEQSRPDVVVLDVEMPIMGGIETLKMIRKQASYLPVIMYSSLTSHGAVVTLEALALGADDYATKPTHLGGGEDATSQVRAGLLPKIRACARVKRRGSQLSAMMPTLAKNRRGQRVDLLAIGASTGGPNAIVSLLQSITRPLPVPVVIVQHMPPVFTQIFAERLSSQTMHRVREGVSGELLKAGDIWIAPGDYHMEVQRGSGGVVLALNQKEKIRFCRPAVDPLFRSLSEIYGANLLAVILTGMGNDGLQGCTDIRAVGGQSIVQDEASSVVWGMPGVVAKAGLAEQILPLSQLGAEILRRLP